MSKKTEKRGGKRLNAGRKKIYKEESKQVYFTIPTSKEKEFIAYCNLFLDPLKKNK